MNFFLKAKPWQLFIMMATPFLVYATSAFGHTPHTLAFLILYFLVVVSGWLFSVGMACNSRLDEPLKINPAPYMACMLVPFLYLFLLFVGFLVPWANGELRRPPQWILPVHFLSIFCFMYAIWYTAKQFVTFVERREVEFMDYYGSFMGFWFCPVGVWFLQPRINRRFA